MENKKYTCECGLCGRKFNENLADDIEGLSLLAEYQGKVYVLPEYKNTPDSQFISSLSDEEREQIEFYTGCPNCKTDGYLSDIEEQEATP